MGVGVGNVCKGLCVVGQMSRRNGPTFRMDSQHETVCRVNVLQMRISAILDLYSGSETLAYRR